MTGNMDKFIEYVSYSCLAIGAVILVLVLAMIVVYLFYTLRAMYDRQRNNYWTTYNKKLRKHYGETTDKSMNRWINEIVRQYKDYDKKNVDFKFKQDKNG